MDKMTQEGGPVESSQQIEVTLLGTGTPRPLLNRFGPGTLIRAGNQVFVFDAGRGIMQRLFQLGVSYARVDAVFLTHLHSDHIVGLPDLWLSGWLEGRRETPIKIFGPEGTGSMMTHLQKAFSYDIKIRIEDDHLSPVGAKVEVIEIGEGVIHDLEGVRITAFDVDHRPITPSFGYRIDYAGHSVLLSGDTRFSKNLIKFASGVDLLVHEVGDARDSLLRKHAPLARAIAHHTNAMEAGEVFRQAMPKLAVYTHIISAGFEVTELIARTRSCYHGPLLVGEDLMRFLIDKDITIYRP